MSFSEVVLFVGLGAVVGFAGGLFAVGGALIAIPLLTAGFGFTQHDSQGKESAGRVGGLKGAAVKLGLPRQTLESKIKALGINKFRFRRSRQRLGIKTPAKQRDPRASCGQ
jgi:hypothetical protein